MVRKIELLAVFVLALAIAMPLASAGVGISWSKESSLVPENTKTCLTYGVYNPWPEDSYITITLSDELMQIVSSSDSDVTFVPKDTLNTDAIPVDFCFKTPVVYDRDCWIGNKLICKQECNEDLKVYEGKVQVTEVSNSNLEKGGAGGSATAMSVSAPLRVKVKCVPHSRNYTLIYILVGLIAGILLVVNLLRKKKKKK